MQALLIYVGLFSMACVGFYLRGLPYVFCVHSPVWTRRATFK